MTKQKLQLLFQEKKNDNLQPSLQLTLKLNIKNNFSVTNIVLERNLFLAKILLVVVAQDRK